MRIARTAAKQAATRTAAVKTTTQAEAMRIVASVGCTAINVDCEDGSEAGSDEDGGGKDDNAGGNDEDSS